MKFLIYVCLFLLPQMCVNASLLTQSDAKFIRSNLSGHSKSTQNSDLVSQGRQRPLFARRLYELRPQPAKTNPNVLPAEVTQLPGDSKCYKVSEGCLPKSHCCDPCAVCRCRFFNAICFCRKTSSCKKRS